MVGRLPFSSDGSESTRRVSSTAAPAPRWRPALPAGVARGCVPLSARSRRRNRRVRARTAAPERTRPPVHGCGKRARRLWSGVAALFLSRSTFSLSPSVFGAPRSCCAQLCNRLLHNCADGPRTLLPCALVRRLSSSWLGNALAYWNEIYPGWSWRQRPPCRTWRKSENRRSRNAGSGQSPRSRGSRSRVPSRSSRTASSSLSCPPLPLAARGEPPRRTETGGAPG